jgi:hypothetical protein
MERRKVVRSTTQQWGDVGKDEHQVRRKKEAPALSSSTPHWLLLLRAHEGVGVPERKGLTECAWSSAPEWT